MRTAQAKRYTLPLVLTVLLLAGCSAEAEPTTSVAATSTTASAVSASSVLPTTTIVDSATTTTGAPLVEETEAPLLVVGDWGSGTEPQGAIAGAMARFAESSAVAAILTTGDNFYTDDAEFLMVPFGWAVDEGIPFWISWGNHDVETPQRISAVMDTFDSPPRWTMTSWGRFDVMILDSNQVSDPGQLDFISEEMASRDAPMIVAFHHPPYSCSQHGSDQAVIDQWLPLFDDDVVLVLSGHEHNYQRFASDGVDWVVSGGGGRNLYEIGACPPGHPPLVAQAETHNFLVLDDSGTELTVTAYDVLNESLDSFTITVP